jgi:1-acyl-sn-glycerol-3-phosphate acyltransferase
VFQASNTARLTQGGADCITPISRLQSAPVGHRWLRAAFRVLFRLLSRSRVEGLDNLPADCPYLLVANHTSIADPPLGYAYLGGPQITGFVASKWRYHPLYLPIILLAGGIFIRRGEVDREALQAAIDWLRGGKCFGMAPEGTRSRSGALQRAKTGAAYLASQVDAPLVPMAFVGTDQAFAALLRFRRPELVLRIGRPFRLPAVDGHDRATVLRAQTDEIMCRIAALLPARYWGYYAHHPRLHELAGRPPAVLAPS